jgi:hypothetical protein
MTHEESDRSDYFDMWGDSKSKSWSQIDDEYRTVILAEAGAGKTEEMKQRARVAVENGRASFFIRIEDIDTDFENAFEVGDSKIFTDWLSSGHEAWFYLDSVDEARLKDPAKFRRALQRFEKRIHSCSHRAHIVVSSRPYAWKPRADRAFMDEILFLPAPNTSGGTEDGGLTKPQSDQSALQVYNLKPLDKSRARKFALCKQVQDFERLWTEIERLDLSDLAERPFDLDAIISKWKKDGVLGGRLKLLKHIVIQRLDEIDPERKRLQPLELSKAIDGARLLAAAVLLTGEAGIEVPDSTSIESGIKAHQILTNWNDNQVRALLERAIFNDVIFGSVRFRHRETRELLAAEWFFELLQNGNSRHTVESLIFREQHGEQFISPRLRPILPWLILFDEKIRNRTLANYPEIAVEGGDPSELPLSTRKKILADIISRISNKSNHGAAIDNNSVARIAQRDLAADVLILIRQYADNEDALSFLAQIVWQGKLVDCVADLISIVTQSYLSDHVKFLVTRAVMTCGKNEQRLKLWSLFIESPDPISRQIVSELLQHSSANSTTVRMLLSSLEKITSHETYITCATTQAIHTLIDQLPIEKITDGSEAIDLLISGVNKILSYEPYIDRGDCHVSKKFVWLLGPATHAVERLILAHHESAMKPDAIAIMQKAPVVRFWRNEIMGDYKDKLSELVPKWPALNDHLFWENIRCSRVALLEKNGEPLTSVWPAMWPGHYWSYDADSFPKVMQFVEMRILEDDKLVALDLAYRIYRDSAKPCDWLEQLNSVVLGNANLQERLDNLQNPPISESDLKWKEKEARYERAQANRKIKNANNRSAWIARLRENPDIICNPPGLQIGVFSYDQLWLLEELIKKGLHIERNLGANWQSLAVEFGDDVARAFRDTAVARWRIYNPLLRSEGAESGSTPYELIFAMLGLEIESKEVVNFPLNLNEEEVKHALRYMTWELNGFPSWLEAMHRGFSELVMSAIQNEVVWEFTNTKNDQPIHYILHDLAYHAPWLHRALYKPMLNWVRTHEIPSSNALLYILRILKNGEEKPDEIVTLAKEKVSFSLRIADFPYWYAILVDADPEYGIVAVEKWLAYSANDKSSKAAQIFITALMGSRHDGNSGPNFGNFREVRYLKPLFVLMHRYIRTNEDINRSGGGAYSPELRDDAQDARDRLFSLLSEIPGKETYVALKELSKNHPDENSRRWMAREAYKRAVEDGELEHWTIEQIGQFDLTRTCMPMSHRQLHDIGIARLIDLKDWLERGNDSPYRTWQRVNDEAEMRNLVAGWLNDHSNSRFSCNQENELANKQRPDICLQSPNVTSAVPMELKLLDKNWSGPKLCERLRNQLAGDYLREEAAGCGVMLLVWQGEITNRRWKINGKNVALTELKEALLKYWYTISHSFPNVSVIEIVVIDLNIRGTKSET